MQNFKYLLGVISLAIVLAVALFFLSPAKTFAQTCGGTPSCTAQAYTSQFLGTYCKHDTTSDPDCVLNFYLDRFSCVRCSGYTDYNTGYTCRVNAASGACSSCVNDDQTCSGYNWYSNFAWYYGANAGNITYVQCYQNVSILEVPTNTYGCSSNVDQKYCASGCRTYCNSSPSYGACTGLVEPANDCGTAYGSQTCTYTQPQTCTYASCGTFSCSQFYNNCNAAAGFSCVGGNTCEKTMGGRITNTETGAGISGVFVSTTRGSDTTDANGYWSVGGFPYGTAFTMTPSASGYPCDSGYVCGGTSPTSPNPGSRSGTVGGGGDCGMSCNFTYTPGHIAGHVYIDYNHNGVLNTGDIGASGITVTADNPTRSDITDGAGAYDIGYLNDGSHTVTVTVPAGFAGVVTSRTVTIGPNNYSTDFYITPLYSISGIVFNDLNLDKSYNNPPDTPFTGGPSISITGPTTTTVTANSSTGIYTSNQTLLSGSYTVTYSTSLPSGYTFQTPSSWIVTVGDRSSGGPICNSGASPDASCSNPNNGSVINLNFGVTNENAWIQPICGDTRFDSGYSQFIPSTADCNGTAAPYAIMNSATFCPTNPGILFSGNTDPFYGSGTGASTSNTVVGNSLFPELYTYKLPNTSQTSYSFVSTTFNNLITAPVSLTSICPNLTNCTLSKNTPGGVYTTTASDGPVKLSINNGDGTYTLGNTNYTFAIGGDLTFMTNVLSPTGYSAAFISGGNIHVDPGVGETDWNSIAPNLEGFFSADNSFYIDTNTTAGSQCLASGQPKDKKLNIQGSVIVNAGVTGGSLINNREGCLQDYSCPVFTVNPNPVLLLHMPTPLKPRFTFWQELNP